MSFIINICLQALKWIQFNDIYLPALANALDNLLFTFALKS